MELKTFDILFVGLKLGKHQFDYEIDITLFEKFGFEEFNDVSLNITAQLDKRSTLMDLHLEAYGTVNVDCDVTNTPFNLPVNTQMDLVVKFGDEFNDENEDLLTLPHGEYRLNIAQYVYEMIVLSLPAKRIHPGIEDGTLKSDVLDKLHELSVDEPNRQKKEDKETDPRWDVLKKLKTDNNL
jgi:uncharacterized metal-binding protein YceD (DUF177 family)